MRFPAPNHSIQPTGASRSGQHQFMHHRRLAPAADAGRSVKKRAIISSIGAAIAVLASSCATRIGEGRAHQLAHQFMEQQGHPQAECLAVGIGPDHYKYVYEINGEQVEVAVDRKTGHVGFEQDSH